ncbi:MAG: serine/threonine-protein kinase [Pirellulales bacterium]
MSTDSSSWAQGSMDDSEDEVVLAVKRYMELLDQCDAPSIENYIKQYPAVAKQLRLALEGLAMVHGGATPSVDASLEPSPENTLGHTAPPQLEREILGKPIGDFQIVTEIGRGGMGVVYEAIQLSLNRRVALKVLPFASGLDKVRLQRFRNEAHAAAGLHHTNIVPVYAVGSERGVHYYAMQLIEGHTLAELIERMRTASSTEHNQPGQLASSSNSGRSSVKTGGASRGANAVLKQLDETFRAASTTMIRSNSSGSHYLESAVEMIVQAAQALQHAHQYGVIHRDIKPGNLLIDQVGKIWVTDFGLAQIQHADNQLTRSGDHVGTLRYMSPEQASGDRDVMDHRSDIYSLGVTLYELLTLEPAVRGENYREMLNHVAEHEPPAPRHWNPAIPQDLDTIVLKAIAKEPSQRYSSAQAFADDLQRWLDDKPIAAKPPTLLQRVAKWRKRNSLLVNMAGLVMIFVTIGLMITTLIVFREQRQTKLALAREIDQRNAAEKSFQQARAAVDTFSELSESELAFRPEVQTLRKKFLETSLEFYRSFLSQRTDDAAVSQELKNVSQKVESILAQLKLLQDSALFSLLEDQRVQADLMIDSEVSQTLVQTIRDYRYAQSQQMEPGDVQYAMSNDDSMLRMKEFVGEMSSQLSASQLNRLQQIAWQLEIPFTFLSDDMVKLLELTPTQRQSISRIIAEHRPGPEMFRQRGGRSGEPMGPDGVGRNGRSGSEAMTPSGMGHEQRDGRPPREFGEAMKGQHGGPQREGFQGAPGGFSRENGPRPRNEHDFGPNGPNQKTPGMIGGRPEDFPRFGDSGPDQPKGMRNDPFFQKVRRETVEHIIREVLSETQRKRWLDIVGPAFP